MEKSENIHKESTLHTKYYYSIPHHKDIWTSFWTCAKSHPHIEVYMTQVGNSLMEWNTEY